MNDRIRDLVVITQGSETDTPSAKMLAVRRKRALSLVNQYFNAHPKAFPIKAAKGPVPYISPICDESVLYKFPFIRIEYV
jgi:hypothetical protein